jgi:ribonucleoside-diphosphate reductase alpha chain
MRVIKRNGTLQQFDVKKIHRALTVAFNEHAESIPNLTPLLNAICEAIYTLDDPASIERIQDIVENGLMDAGHHKVAKAYILYRDQRSRLRTKRSTPDNKALADYIHAAKYARYIESLGRRETYLETVHRVEDMHIDRFPQFKPDILEAFEYVRSYKVLPSMRSMQFAGSAIHQHNARLYNCAFTHASRMRVFADIFYLLLCGCGVGYSVQWYHVDQLDPISVVDKKDVKHHEIEDSIVGWANAVEALIKSFMYGYWIEFNYSSIRPEGANLKTSGGKAPGHLPLRHCLETIRENLVRAQGRKLRPIEVHDIICHLASAVLSGGIRRSSLIALFSANDTEMLYAKARGSFRPSSSSSDDGLNNQRQMANNSAVLYRKDADRIVFDRIIRIAEENYGDPGFFFTDNTDFGTNPCGEIGLYPVTDTSKGGVQFCNLCEVNVALCENASDLYVCCKAAAIIGTLQAAYTDFNYLGKDTEFITKRDALLGVSLMGIMNKPDIALRDDYLTHASGVVYNTNKEWAEKLGINQAVRATCVKPGGTAPLEASAKVPVASGIHPHHARRFFRRVTANPNEPAAQYFKSINPHMVDIMPNGDWSIIFPQQVPDDSVVAKNLTACEFLDNVFKVYDHWVKPCSYGDLTHNVSTTVTMRPDEIDDVINHVWDNRHRVAALTFVPHTLDTIFPYAPRKEVNGSKDEALWNSLIENYVPVDWGGFTESTDETQVQMEFACVGEKECNV